MEKLTEAEGYVRQGTTFVREQKAVLLNKERHEGRVLA